ncbi:MAG: DUF1569 domain-containing protein [Mucilaginibacter sp.]
MKSVFDPTVNAELIARINQLTPTSNPLWGKMSVGQMLAHCQVLLQVTFGELQLKRGLMGFLFGKMAKRQILTGEQVKRNMPTFSLARMTDEKDFKAEKQKLIEMVQRFTAGPGVLSPKPHPFFGPLTTDEWDQLQYKHLDHHLKQFGV